MSSFGAKLPNETSLHYLHFIVQSSSRSREARSPRAVSVLSRHQVINAGPDDRRTCILVELSTQ